MGNATLYLCHRCRQDFPHTGTTPVCPRCDHGGALDDCPNEPVNPQAFKADGGKPRFDLLFDGVPNALLDVAKVLTWAVESKHYRPHSWKEVPEAKRRYRAALQRHENAIARGEVNDPESGLPHRAHIACNALFLAELDYIKE